MKKFLVVIFAGLMVVSSCVMVFASKPMNKLEDGVNDMVYGVVEVPDNVDETGTKGSPAYTNCTTKTNDGVGRGIARFVGGLWKVATFWYPDQESAEEPSVIPASGK